MSDELNTRSAALINAITKITHIGKDRLVSKSRLSPIVEARACIIYILVASGFSFTEIGRVFNRNHSTVLYSYKNIQNRLTGESFKDKKLVSTLKQLAVVNNNFTESLLHKTI